MRFAVLAFVWLVPIQAQESFRDLSIIFPRDVILSKMEKAITRHEHCLSWNNPGCLTYARQKEARRMQNGYARFTTMQAGIDALRADLIAKFERGMTVQQIMLAWNHGRYLTALLRETSLSPNSKF